MFQIPGATSLKDKRAVVVSIKERCKNKFNVSVVEMATDQWQIGTLGFAIASISAGAASQTKQNIIDFLYQDDRIDIIGIEKF